VVHITHSCDNANANANAASQSNPVHQLQRPPEEETTDSSSARSVTLDTWLGLLPLVESMAPDGHETTPFPTRAAVRAHVAVVACWGAELHLALSFALGGVWVPIVLYA
jgi:hypothetical protein